MIKRIQNQFIEFIRNLHKEIVVNTKDTFDDNDDIGRLLDYSNKEIEFNKILQQVSTREYIFTEIINNTISLNVNDNVEFTALMVICRYGLLNCAEMLINMKAKVDILTSNNSTALSYICMNLRIDKEITNNKDNIFQCINLLIDNNTNINNIDNCYYTPLMYTCHANNPIITRLLLDRNADINLSGGYIPCTPVMVCIKTKSIETLSILLEYKNIDMSIKGNLDNTIIIQCCLNNDINILQLLLKYKDDSTHEDNGININITNIYGYTALMYACELCYIEIVELLLSSKADINIIDKKGNTAKNKTKNNYILSILETETVIT
jgi:ankyrin repeat protein